MTLGAMAVCTLRMESLVEPGHVVKKKKVLVFLFFKLATGGNKEYHTGFLAAETHKLGQQLKQM